MTVSHNANVKRKIAKTISLLIDERNDVAEFIQLFLVDRLLWAATEYDDTEKWNKYFGVPFWSHGAINKVVENINLGKKPDKELVHEHSVPKCILGEKLDEMYANKQISEEQIFSLIDKFCHAVVVTKEEDAMLNKAGFRSKMPSSFGFHDDDDMFCRYHLAGIKISTLTPLALQELQKGQFPSEGSAV